MGRDYQPNKDLTEKEQADRILAKINVDVKNEKRVFGDTFVGIWRCSKCSYTIFPRRLKIDEDLFMWSNESSSLHNGSIGPHCKECGTPMDYDEEA